MDCRKSTSAVDRVNRTPNRHYRTINPTNGKPLETFTTATYQNVAELIETPDHTTQKWHALSMAHRQKALKRFAHLIEKCAVDIAGTLAEESGKPIQHTLREDIPSAIRCIRYDEAKNTTPPGTPRTYDTHNQNSHDRASFVFFISSGHTPIQDFCKALIHTVISGQHLLFDVYSGSPNTVIRLTNLVEQSGLPSRFCQTILADNLVKRQLLKHPKINEIFFTGTYRTAQPLASLAKHHRKPISCELTVKTPMILFESADIDKAIRNIITSNFFRREFCPFGTPIYVHESIKDSFTDRLTTAVDSLIVGDPTSPTTEIGPLRSVSERNRLLRHLKLALAEGATLITGGRAIRNKQWRRGAFIEPTILTNCEPDMQIMYNDVDSICLHITHFSGTQEVIARATSTPYFCYAGAFSKDDEQIDLIKSTLDGSIDINLYNPRPKTFSSGEAFTEPNTQNVPIGEAYYVHT